VSTMQPLDRVTLPPGTTVRLKPGGIHGMLEGLDPVPVAGDTLRVTLEVRAGGRVTVEARVVPYAEVAR
jgi:copper(I)-binding protein